MQAQMPPGRIDAVVENGRLCPALYVYCAYPTSTCADRTLRPRVAAGQACVIIPLNLVINPKIELWCGDGESAVKGHLSNARAIPQSILTIKLHQYLIPALPLLARTSRAYTTTASIMTTNFATPNSTAASSSRSSLSAGSHDDIGEPPLSPSEQVEIELSQARELPSGFMSSLSAWWGSTESASKDSELRLLRYVKRCCCGTPHRLISATSDVFPFSARKTSPM